MFRSKKTKKIVVSSLLGIMLLSTVAFAANGIFDKKITATHGRIKLSYQGEDITKSVEDKYGAPAFTVKEYDGRAYVPVRALADIMGVSVTYDSSTHTASFVDSEKLVLNKQLELKDQEIAALQAEINQLKNKVKEEEKKEESSKTDIKELEKKLNKDYGVVDDVSFDITLKETSSRITATMTIDTRDHYESNAWRKMRVADKKSLMEDIAEDISKAFKNHKVEGSIYDNYQRYTLYTFTMNNNGKVTVSDRDYGYDYGYGYGDYRDVEKYLEDDLYKAGFRSATVRASNESSSTVYVKISLGYSPSDDDRREIKDIIYDLEKYLNIRIDANVSY